MGLIHIELFATTASPTARPPRETRPHPIAAPGATTDEGGTDDPYEDDAGLSRVAVVRRRPAPVAVPVGPLVKTKS